jgi:histidine triad (HIT) family protein
MTQIVPPRDCLFCKIAGKEIAARIAYEDERFVAFHDVNPQAPVHLLIVPREHIGTLNDVRMVHEELMGGMFLVAQKLAADFKVAASGWRAVFNCNEGAGQSVWHIHLHVLGGRPFVWPPG